MTDTRTFMLMIDKEILMLMTGTRISLFMTLWTLLPMTGTVTFRLMIRRWTYLYMTDTRII